MTNILAYLIACGIGSVICIAITLSCFKILEKWDNELKGDVE